MKNNEFGKQKCFGKNKQVNKLLKCLNEHILLLENVYNRISDINKTINDPLSISLYENAKAIHLLVKNNQSNEAFIIARSLIERLIVLYFIDASGEEVSKDYVDYARQKAYRAKNNELVVNDYEVSITPENEINFDDYPELKDSIKKFSGKNGAPKTRWSSLNLQKKLKAIDEKSDVDIIGLITTLNFIYPSASEALHGTLYGCTFHFLDGMADAKQSHDDLKKNFFSSLNGLLGMVIFLINQLISESINVEFRNSTLDKQLKQLYDKNKKLYKNLTLIMAEGKESREEDGDDEYNIVITKNKAK